MNIGKSRSFIKKVLYFPKAKAMNFYSRFLKCFWGPPSINLESIVSSDIQVESPILDGISLPPYHETDDHDDFTPLMKIAKYISPKNILELGTAYGNTVANLCNNIESSVVYTVNALRDQQTGEKVTYVLEKEDIGKVYKKHGFADRVVQIYENTLHLDLSKYINGSFIDMAIIDACHDTRYVINDFLKTKPFIKKGGIALFHDTHPSMRDHLRSSYLACAILRMKGYDIKHIENTWWAIWFND